ncbi:MAG: heavy metal translocating P-type ATPase [Armatimonadetes bacterium]|nr:heavy metal translocating P-type ATPase [Armatimonadota bacterium]
MPETTLGVDGMTCAACVARVERKLKSVPGVELVEVSFATHTARIVHEGAPQELLEQAVEKAGYGIRELTPESDPSQVLLDRSTAKRADVILASVLALPIFVISMASHMRPEWVNWALGVLTTIVMASPGRGIYVTAWRNIRHKTTTMDTLIALGTLAAWGMSVYGLLAYRDMHSQSMHVYFESSAVIVTLVLLGRAIEAGATSAMSQAIAKLKKLTPELATRILPDGTHEHVAPSLLRVGDAILIRPGERVPADAEIREGFSALDESMMTGEPFPVERGIGDPITGGTLNGDGALIARVTAASRQSMLAQIISMVERAQGSKAPIQQLADRVAAIFVPIVLALAAVAFLGTGIFVQDWEQASIRAVAVLVIACPCALGLATPTAIVAGIGRAAELGLLIKSGDVLQRAAGIRDVLFDKTGTLTEGKPRLASLHLAAEAENENELICRAGALESASEHPLAKAILAEVQSRDLILPEATEVSAVRGAGLTGKIDGRAFTLSKPSPSEELDPLTERWIERERELGRTVTLLFQNKELLGGFAFEDTIRPSAPAAITALGALGISSEMATGDHERAARSVARAVGISEVAFDQSPSDKLEHATHRRLAMVGDGINDAPVLAQAEVGIALRSGSDIAREAADITLIHHDLMGVPRALALSRETLRVIKQNLGWAFGYNVVMIPLAMLGMLNPMLAAGAMAISSISVVLNSLRLRRWKAKF